jgi:hypothetical protein
LWGPASLEGRVDTQHEDGGYVGNPLYIERSYEVLRQLIDDLKR